MQAVPAGAVGEWGAGLVCRTLQCARVGFEMYGVYWRLLEQEGGLKFMAAFSFSGTLHGQWSGACWCRCGCCLAGWCEMRG